MAIVSKESLKNAMGGVKGNERGQQICERTIWKETYLVLFSPFNLDTQQVR